MSEWKSNPETQATAAGEYPTQSHYGLRNCYDAEDAVVDIIFIHGMTGNRETTWTDKTSGIFWPEQFLKGDVPKSRILTYGYDADFAHLWSMAPNNRIVNHALNLANAISQLRNGTKTAERPMVFVTHSLGGLLFEDAVLSSRNSAQPHVQGILAHTIGVCFLGTPHCGSKFANWAVALGKLVNVAKQTNTSLLSVLRPKSEVLCRIQSDFHNALSVRNAKDPKMEITCFYEMEGVTGIGKIVPQESATLKSYNSIGINANHMNMPKFSNPKDAGYLAISAEIIRWVREHTSKPSLQPTPAISPPPTTHDHEAHQSYHHPSPGPHAQQGANTPNFQVTGEGKVFQGFNINSGGGSTFNF